MVTLTLMTFLKRETVSEILLHVLEWGSVNILRFYVCNFCYMNNFQFNFFFSYTRNVTRQACYHSLKNNTKYDRNHSQSFRLMWILSRTVQMVCQCQVYSSIYQVIVIIFFFFYSPPHRPHFGNVLSLIQRLPKRDRS